MAREKDWDDVWRFQIGLEYKANDWLDLRLGYVFDESPIPDEWADYLIPTNDRQLYSIGCGMHWDTWIVDLSYTYLDQNKRIEGVAGNVLQWINRFFWKSFTLQTTTSFIDDLQFSDSDEDYCVNDLKLSYQLDKNVDMSFRVSNIFDEDYQVVEGYPMPGRWLWAEMSLRF